MYMYMYMYIYTRAHTHTYIYMVAGNFITYMVWLKSFFYVCCKRLNDNS